MARAVMQWQEGRTMPEEIGPVSAIRDYFSTPEKPVTTAELKALGVQGIKELAPACAEALRRELKKLSG